jgi:HEXXH motif-containing protein
MAIYWDLMSRPQPDQYDSRVTFAFATASDSPRCGPRYIPIPVGGEPSICDGEVAIRYLRDESPIMSPRTQNAPLYHANLANAVEYLKRWPEGYRQFQSLMNSVHPIDLADSEGVTMGSISHSDESHFGTMYGSVFDTIGLAEAFAHELAHNKLRALGLGVETPRHLILNPVSDTFASPVKRVGQRPMSAVFHAEYSFLYIANLDLEMVSHEMDAQVRRRLLASLSKNLTKIEAGWKVIEEHSLVDADGSAFLRGTSQWLNEILERGKYLISRE